MKERLSMVPRRVAIAILALLLAVGLGIGLWQALKPSGPAAPTVVLPLNPTEAGFDSDHFTCAGQQLPVDETFSTGYAACRDQLVKDVEFLADHHVRVIRIWPVVSQFFVHEPRDPHDLTYDSELNPEAVANLEDFLDVLRKHHMQAMVALNMHTNCAVHDGVPDIHDEMRFNYKLLYDPGDPSLLPSYLNGLRLFVEHFRDNDVIRSYDLMNEVNNLVDVLDHPRFWAQCFGIGPTSVPPPPTLKTDIYGTLTKIYDTVKAADTTHPVTFSLGNSTAARIGEGAIDPDLLGFVRSHADYYDFHAYVNLPTAGPEAKVIRAADWFGYAFPVLPTDKPIILGEIGVSKNGVTPQGRPCVKDITSKKGDLPPMNDYCQRAFLSFSRQFTAEASAHRIGAIYFHSLWENNSFAYAEYDEADLAGFASSSGADYLFAYDDAYYRAQ